MTENSLNFESIQQRAADPVYGAWLAENLPRKADLLRMAETWQSFSDRPLMSIIMPIYNPPASFLEQAIESVIAQIYPHWELCLADDASTQPHVREILQSYSSRDDRIKVTFRSENGHISACSNSALELATGEFIGLLDHDDLLTPDALYEVVRLLNQHPADMFYSDEDKVDEQGKFKDPFFKPDWSPDSFLSRMYTCHFGVYRRSLVNQIGGFRLGYEGSQDYDLVLRLTEKTDQIIHIPKILYHWRIHTLSVASGVAAKPYAVNAAENALNDALVRRQENGQVKQVGNLGAYIPRYRINQPQTVSIILFSPQGSTKTLIKDRDARREKISALIHADLKNSDSINVEVISAPDQISKKHLSSDTILSTVSAIDRTQREADALGWIAALNQAVGAAKGDYLCFLQDTIEPIGPGWIAALLEQAQRQSIGCVGGLLLRPDQTVLHAGIVLGLGGLVAALSRCTAKELYNWLKSLLSRAFNHTRLSSKGGQKY